jgi:hypothetical protein
MIQRCMPFFGLYILQSSLSWSETDVWVFGRCLDACRDGRGKGAPSVRKEGIRASDAPRVARTLSRAPAMSDARLKRAAMHTGGATGMARASAMR